MSARVSPGPDTLSITTSHRTHTHSLAVHPHVSWMVEDVGNARVPVADRDPQTTGHLSVVVCWFLSRQDLRLLYSEYRHSDVVLKQSAVELANTLFEVCRGKIFLSTYHTTSSSAQ